jgi:outer membrane protein insertion porin family
MKPGPLLALALAAALGLATPLAYAQQDAGAPVPDPTEDGPRERAAPDPTDESTSADEPAAPTTSAVPQVAAPSPLLADYRLEGTLLEAREVIHGFLDEIVPVGQPWTDQQQRDVIEQCLEVGYHASIRSELIGQAHVRAYLNLQPVTLVRHIKVNIRENTLLQRLSRPARLVQDTLFETDIERRMRLSEGRPFPLDEVNREARLAEEKQRLLDYLRDEGFFEAQVALQAVPHGAYGVDIEVDVMLGPAYFVGRVSVLGNREVADDEIRKLFHHQRLLMWPRRFNRDQLKRDIDAVAALYRSRGFPGARVRTDFDRSTSFKRNRREVDFAVIVRERRRIEIYFEGNATQDDASLRSQLTLDDEGTYDDVEIQRSAQAIRSYYQSQGYFEASVLWERVSFRMPEQLFDRIVFTIDEGPKLQVKRIDFKGNTAVNSTVLEGLIKTRVFPSLPWQSGGYVTSAQLQQDVQRIVNLYRSRGYAEAEVHYEVSRDPRLLGNAAALAAAILSGLPAQGLYVRFVIEERAPQEVSGVDVEFDGPHRKAPQELLRVTRLKPGSYFTQAQAESDSDRIQRFYFEHGYPYAEVATEQERDPHGRVRVIHKVREGVPVRFGKVALRGNFRTRPWVVFEEMQLEEGDAFTLGRAEAAQRNLRTSGLFSNVRFKYIGLDDSNRDVVNVVLHLQERYDYLLDYALGAGFSSDEREFIEATLGFPHIMGTGARLNARGLFGRQEQAIEGKLLLPRWIQRRVFRLGFLVEATGFYRREDTERFGQLLSFGGSLGAGVEGQPGGNWDGWFFGVRYNLRQRNRTEELIRIPGAGDDESEAPIKTRTGAIGPQLVIDKRTDERGRRNPLSPEAGWRAELSVLFADESLFGDDRFVKIGLKGLHYSKPGRRFLLTNGLRYDHGIPMGGAVVLPEVERFFAGGDTTVRGFEEDRMLTEIVEADLPPLGGIPQFRVLPAGGNIRLIHNLDLQVQVWDQSFLKNLPWASAIFVDTGMITNSLDGLERKQFRNSLGIAFWRLVTPVGSFSFEWAVPLSPQRGDNPRGRLHLNLGFVFK